MFNRIFFTRNVELINKDDSDMKCLRSLICGKVDKANVMWLKAPACPLVCQLKTLSDGNKQSTTFLLVHIQPAGGCDVFTSVSNKWRVMQQPFHHTHTKRWRQSGGEGETWGGCCFSSRGPLFFPLMRENSDERLIQLSGVVVWRRSVIWSSFLIRLGTNIYYCSSSS